MRVETLGLAGLALCLALAGCNSPSSVGAIQTDSDLGGPAALVAGPVNLGVPALSLSTSDDQQFDAAEALSRVSEMHVEAPNGSLTLTVAPTLGNELLVVDLDVYTNANTLTDPQPVARFSEECANECLAERIIGSHLRMELSDLETGEVVIVSAMVVTSDGVVGQSWGFTVFRKP